MLRGMMGWTTGGHAEVAIVGHRGEGVAIYGHEIVRDSCADRLESRSRPPDRPDMGAFSDTPDMSNPVPRVRGELRSVGAAPRCDAYCERKSCLRLGLLFREVSGLVLSVGMTGPASMLPTYLLW